MQQSAKFWDKAAEKYAKSPIQDVEAYDYTLKRTRSYLSSTDKVLELGCGTGSTALLLAADVDQIVASDVSPNMIEIASRKAQLDQVPNVRFITADIFDKKIGEGPYDVVLAFNLLHLIEDTADAIQRIHGLLKPDGTFISKTVCKPGKEAPLKYRFFPLLIPMMQLLGKAPFVRFMEIGDFEDLIETQGFKILESGNHPAPSRYIIARKV